MTRVVVTGIGVVSPVGNDREAAWSALVAGRSGGGPISLFDASAFPVRIAAEVKGFDAGKMADEFPAVVRTRDRKVALALSAAREAIADSGLGSPIAKEGDWGPLPPAGLADASLHLAVGLEVLCLEDLTPLVPTSSGFGDAVASVLPSRLNGRWLQTPLDFAADLLGERYGLAGGRFVNCSACAAGTMVVGEAWQLLREGGGPAGPPNPNTSGLGIPAPEVAVVGAADSMLNPLGVGGFSLLRVLSDENDCPTTACRPFDATRKGTMLGEGAAFLVLETFEHALRRGAKVYAEVLGYGCSMDAFRVSDPDPGGRGAVASMAAALASAGLAPQDIDCVSAHGTGTPKNDAVETAAIREVLGPRADRIPVHAIKSMTGYMIAASGAVEAAAAALTIDRGLVPPTINLHHPDAQCDLDYVPNAARPFDGRTVMSNSFGFGGQNATLILGSPQ